METYNKLKSVPSDMLKQITGGRLKGMSDIKPQWRIEKLTEVFGLCGFGWKFEITNKWIEQGAKNEAVAFVDLYLYVKVEEKWSEPIYGNGGSMFITAEKNGLYTSDEAYKMAITDALGTAAKCIGLAADVYMGQGGKYPTEPKVEPQQITKKPFQQIMFDQLSTAIAENDKEKSKKMIDYLNSAVENVPADEFNTILFAYELNFNEKI